MFDVGGATRDYMQTLKAQGYGSIPGYRNLGLHPYAIALAEGSFNVWGKQVEGVLCLLRWPDPKEVINMEMPIAVMERGNRSMQLVARSPSEYTKRVLVEEDQAAGADGNLNLVKDMDMTRLSEAFDSFSKQPVQI